MDKKHIPRKIPSLEYPPLPLWVDGRINCFDPFGSYTGRCLDPDEKPIQDADDL